MALNNCNEGAEAFVGLCLGVGEIDYTLSQVRYYFTRILLKQGEVATRPVTWETWSVSADNPSFS